MTYILMNNGAALKTTNSKVRAYLMAWRHGWKVGISRIRL